MQSQTTAPDRTDTQLWNQTLNTIQTQISFGNYLTWFKDTSFSRINAHKGVVMVASAFTYEWLKSKYSQLILEAIQTHDPNIEKVSFIIDASTRSPMASHRKINTRIDRLEKQTAEILRIVRSTDDRLNNHGCKGTGLN